MTMPDGKKAKEHGESELKSQKHVLGNSLDMPSHMHYRISNRLVSARYEVRLNV